MTRGELAIRAHRLGLRASLLGDAATKPKTPVVTLEPDTCWWCPHCEHTTLFDPDSEPQCDYCGLMKFEVEEETWSCSSCDGSNRSDSSHCTTCGALVTTVLAGSQVLRRG